MNLSKLNPFRNMNLRRKVERSETVQKAIVFGFTSVFLLSLVGYILNIVKIFLLDWDATVTNELFVRLFGVVTGLGAFIGWF